MIVMKLSALTPAAACLLLLAACDDGPAPPPPPNDSGLRDTGMADVGPPMDGGEDPMDGGDSSTPPPGDAGPLSCTVSPDDVYALAVDPRAAPRLVGFAAAADGFGVVWNETRDGFPDIYGQRIGSDGIPGPEVEITSDPSQDRAPQITPVGTQWIAAYVSNEGTTGFELRTQLLSADLSLVGSPNIVTDTPAQLEDNPVFLGGASGVLLSWVEDDMIALTRTGRARALNADGSASGGVQTTTAAANKPGQIAIGELDAGPVLVWSEGVGGTGDVLMQGLDASGARRGAVSTLSAEGNADGTVDAALGVTGGAVVFGVLVGGVRSEVRFRALDMEGALVGDERILTDPPTVGTDASIARFAGGYVVSYRALPEGGMPAQIRVLLVSEFGDVVETITLTDAAEGGGRTTVRVTGDGQIGVAWADDAAGGTEVRFGLLRCGGGS
ncbi:MAG: hypothetical protein SangKO_060880 [Sandaracinaceae bacterium]